MKAVCHICEQTLELVKVVFGEDSGIEGKGFYLIPEHGPSPGKKTTQIVSEQTGEVIRTMCDGTHRPPKKKEFV